MSGCTPFYAPTWSTQKIVDHIQRGSFSLDDPEWSNISCQAKDLIEGLLTVNTSQRLTLDSLSRHPWLMPDSAPSTPLNMTNSLKKFGGTETAINHTLHAYHQASREGVVLGDPSQNPLARKRKQKSGHSPIPSGKTDGTRPSTLDINNS